MADFDMGEHGFVDEQPPEFWKRTSPMVLAKNIEQADSTIEFHPGEHHEFVRALARVKRAIPRARWHGILERLEPTVWTSCFDGPDWDPRVLGNGGVAIRNFHRVLGIDLDDGVSVSGIEPAQIRRDVRTVLHRGLEAADPRVMLVHHGPQGINFSQRILEGCRFHGQSILFAPASLVKGLKVLGLAVRSQPEMLAIRLFENTVCIYPLYRHSDDADTVVESFAVARFDSDETFHTINILDGTNAWPRFRQWVNNDLDQELPHCDVPASLQKDIRTLMTSDKPNSWASQLFELINQFPPLFGKDPLQPSNADPATALITGKRRCCIYTFGVEVATARVERAITAFHMKGAKLVRVPGLEGIQSIRTPYLNLAESRKMAAALRRRFGPLRLTIPHLGLDHHEAAGDISEGNGAWYGFARRNGVKVLA